jgi:hypothetical protein
MSHQLAGNKKNIIKKSRLASRIAKWKNNEYDIMIVGRRMVNMAVRGTTGRHTTASPEAMTYYELNDITNQPRTYVRRSSPPETTHLITHHRTDECDEAVEITETPPPATHNPIDTTTTG